MIFKVKYQTQLFPKPKCWTLWETHVLVAKATITGHKTSFYQKINFLKIFNLTTNIFMLVHLEPILGFILVAAMCFNMGYLVKKLGKNEEKLEVSILTWHKKGALGLSIYLAYITFQNSFLWAFQNFVIKLILMGPNCSQDQTLYPRLYLLFSSIFQIFQIFL